MGIIYLFLGLLAFSSCNVIQGSYYPDVNHINRNIYQRFNPQELNTAYGITPMDYTNLPAVKHLAYPKKEVNRDLPMETPRNNQQDASNHGLEENENQVDWNNNEPSNANANVVEAQEQQAPEPPAWLNIPGELQGAPDINENRRNSKENAANSEENQNSLAQKRNRNRNQDQNQHSGVATHLKRSIYRSEPENARYQNLNQNGENNRSSEETSHNSNEHVNSEERNVHSPSSRYNEERNVHSSSSRYNTKPKKPINQVNLKNKEIQQLNNRGQHENSYEQNEENSYEVNNKKENNMDNIQDKRQRNQENNKKNKNQIESQEQQDQTQSMEQRNQSENNKQKTKKQETNRNKKQSPNTSNSKIRANQEQRDELNSSSQEKWSNSRNQQRTSSSSEEQRDQASVSREEQQKPSLTSNKKQKNQSSSSSEEQQNQSSSRSEEQQNRSSSRSEEQQNQSSSSSEEQQNQSSSSSEEQQNHTSSSEEVMNVKNKQRKSMKYLEKQDNYIQRNSNKKNKNQNKKSYKKHSKKRDNSKTSEDQENRKYEMDVQQEDNSNEYLSSDYSKVQKMIKKPNDQIEEDTMMPFVYAMRPTFKTRRGSFYKKIITVSFKPEEVQNTIRGFNNVEDMVRYHETLQAASQDYENMTRNSTQLLKSNNYPVEEHNVTTEDGYILQLIRVSSGSQELKPKPVVFLMHGFLGSSDDWLLMGPKKSLPYMLADQGYDVWMGNARGNKYSQKHVKMTPEQEEFWQYSNDEVALRDLPAMLDYALNTTNEQKMFFVGFSQGNAQLFALASTRPEYNKKIQKIYALSPMSYMKNSRSNLVQMLAPENPLSTIISDYMQKHLKNGEFKTQEKMLKLAGKGACMAAIGCETACSNINFVMSGVNVEQLTPELAALIVKHMPAGGSVRQMMQLGQATEDFRMFDYGTKKNQEVYGSSEPPSYNMKLVSAPVEMFSSKDDWLAATEDVEKLEAELPNIERSYKIRNNYFTNLDFLYGKMATEMYRNIIKSMVNTRKNA